MAENQNQNGDGAAKQPLYRVTSGSVLGSIFENQRDDGEITHSVNLSRSYMTEQGWKRTNSFRPQDMADVQSVVSKVREVMQEKLGYSMDQAAKVSNGQDPKQAQKGKQTP